VVEGSRARPRQDRSTAVTAAAPRGETEAFIARAGRDVGVGVDGEVSRCRVGVGLSAPAATPCDWSPRSQLVPGRIAVGACERRAPPSLSN
jgi:hypothetical protein